MSDKHRFLGISGELDEFYTESADIHIERLDEACFWIGIETPGKCPIGIRTGYENGRWFFILEEDAMDGRTFHIERTPAAVDEYRTKQFGEVKDA